MSTIHSTGITILVLAMALILATPGAGLTAKVYEGDTNPENFGMTDYHVEIKADKPITDVSGVLSDDGFFPEPTIGGEGTNTVTLDWWVIDVPPGDSIGICVWFNTAAEGYSIKKSWTAVKSTVQLAIPVVGADLERKTLGLSNSYQIPIQLTDLRYTVLDAEIEKSDERFAELMEGLAAGEPVELNVEWTPLGDGIVPAMNDAGGLGTYDIEDMKLDSDRGKYLYTSFGAEFLEEVPAGSLTILMHER